MLAAVTISINFHNIVQPYYLSSLGQYYAPRSSTTDNTSISFFAFFYLYSKTKARSFVRSDEHVAPHDKLHILKLTLQKNIHFKLERALFSITSITIITSPKLCQNSSVV